MQMFALGGIFYNQLAAAAEAVYFTVTAERKVNRWPRAGEQGQRGVCLHTNTTLQVALGSLCLCADNR